jgi:crotonobetainyl-CoA:carnitine CoA-transferase CaiB-like acyl-CoA transferase
VGNDGQFAKLCAVLGLDLAADPDFATNPARVRNRARLIAPIQAAVAGWTKQALSDALEAESVPAGPINDVGEVFADPQVVARGMRIVAGGLSGVASPIVIDGERMVSDLPSPARPKG